MKKLRAIGRKATGELAQRKREEEKRKTQKRRPKHTTRFIDTRTIRTLERPSDKRSKKEIS